MEVLQRTANRGSVSTGYNIDNSLKFEADNTEYLSHTSSGSSGTKLTFSFWTKRTELDSSGSNYMLLAGVIKAGESVNFYFNADKIRVDAGNGGNGYRIITNSVYRDTASWYHMFVVIDTTLSTSSDRIQLWINGVRQTDLGTDNQPTQNFSTGVDVNNAIWRYGAYDNTYYHYSGYIAEAHKLDGIAASCTDFGEFDEDSAIWIPKKYSGSYGTNGHYLKFADSSSLGTDSSGNSNDFTLNNIAAADQATDTPTNNFAVANVLIGTGGFFVTTEGATKGVLSTAGPGNNVGGVSLMSTLAPSSGKWYFEAQNTNSGDVYLFLGVADTASIGYTDGYVLGGQNGTTPSIAWRGGGAYDGSAKVYSNNSATGSSVNWETEVVGVALDLDNNKIYFHKSGTWINSGDPANGTDNGGQYDLPTAEDGQWLLGVSGYNLATWLLNFGGYTTMSISSAASDANGYGTFEYAPPTGYYALCTKNLAEYG